MRRQKALRLNLISGDLAATVLLGALFFVGGAVGCIVAAGIGGAAGSQLQTYLQTYFMLAKERSVEVPFLPVLWEQFQYPLLLLLFGFTAIGVLGIPILFSVRGFLFAFSVACFYRVLGWAALVPAMVLFGLPALMWVPAFFVLGTQAMCSAYTLFSGRTGERQSSLAWQGVDWIRSGLCAVVLALCVAFECLVLPVLVGASAGFVL